MRLSRRTATAALTGLVVVAAILLQQLGRESIEPQRVPEPKQQGELGAEETVRVARVVDGDTVELADGRKVRYLGLDTPESVDPRKPVQCFGKAATEANRKLVEGKEVRLVPDVENQDRYGRMLRYVYVGDFFVNLELVRQGFAYSYPYPPNVTHEAEFHAAQTEARAAKLGLWGGCSGKDQAPHLKRSSGR